MLCRCMGTVRFDGLSFLFCSGEVAFFSVVGKAFSFCLSSDRRCGVLGAGSVLAITPLPVLYICVYLGWSSFCGGKGKDGVMLQKPVACGATRQQSKLACMKNPKKQWQKGQKQPALWRFWCDTCVLPRVLFIYLCFQL